MITSRLIPRSTLALSWAALLSLSGCTEGSQTPLVRGDARPPDMSISGEQDAEVDAMVIDADLRDAGLPDLDLPDLGPQDAMPPPPLDLGAACESPPEPDAGPDMDLSDASDAEIPDAEIPDAEQPDAEQPDADLADASDAAELPDAELPDAEPSGPCGDQAACVGGNCQVFPTGVYRISEARIVTPAGLGALNIGLTAFLASEDLNLLMESAGYTEEGLFRWYIGNGLREPVYNPEDPCDLFQRISGRYHYNHEAPIQALDGQWFEGEGGRPAFVQSGRTNTFVLTVPDGRQVIVADDCTEDENDTIQLGCFSTIPVVGRTRIQLEDGSPPRISGRISGYVTELDAGKFTIRFRDREIPLIDQLEPGDLNVDLNRDGVADAFQFEIEFRATQTIFTDPDPTRNPDPIRRSDEACGVTRAP